MEEESKAAFFGLKRHCIASDGKGVTTLVGFYGCPLRCRFCINPQSFDAGTHLIHMTPEQLYETVKVDQLYYLASGGGITFGGGEPLLHPDFLTHFRALCGPAWHLCAETSLNVPWKNVRAAADCIDDFMIDCKDTSPDIYQAYTEKNNNVMLENLQKLAELKTSKHIIVRIPLIPGYNCEEDRARSVERLRAMGLDQFDLFTYQIPSKKAKSGAFHPLTNEK